ncbi:MAG: STAS domain-containing protein [Chloroflexota bacterium]
MNQMATMNVRAVDKAGIVDIQGELTAQAEQALSDAYARASDGANAVILNFDGLEYMNSSGIGLLVTLLIRANRQKKRLLTCGLSDHYRHIFQLTRLDDAIGIYATEADALGAAAA